MMRKNRRKLIRRNIRLIILIIFSIITIIFSFNNYFLYHTPIMKIQKIENNNLEGTEQISQKITGIIKNGKYKGKIVSVTNETYYSGVYEEKIHKFSELFIGFSKDGHATNIEGIKRDKYVVLLTMIFLDATILIGGLKGIKSIISLLANIIITISTLYFYIMNSSKISILPLFFLLTLFFIISSLIISNGKNKKTYAAIISTIVSLTISFTISFLVLNIYSDSIYFGNMDYVEILKEYKGIFYVNILLSGLGAIMDIAISLASSLNELITKDNNITYKALKKSGQEISKDLLGTMCNILLFTCYSSIIPIVLLAIKNMMPLSTAINIYGQLELIRVLTSCISIVLAVPISLYISLWMFNRRKRND